MIARRQTGCGVVPVSRVGLNSIPFASRGPVPAGMAVGRAACRLDGIRACTLVEVEC